MSFFSSFNQNKKSDFQRLFEHAPVCMVLVDIEGKVILINECVEASLGYSISFLKNKHFSEILISERNDQQIFNKIQKSLMEGSKQYYELRRKLLTFTNDELEMVVRISYLPSVLNQENIFLVQLTDITNIIKTKNLLSQKNDELIKANKELDNIIYSVAHDLRAPLTSLIGLIYVIKDENEDDRLNRYLDMMWNSVFRLDEFIREIVENSKNNRLNLSIEKVDIEEIIQAAFDNHKYLKNADKIEKRLNFQLNIPLHSDSMRLMIIFNNLVSNAIHYSVTYDRDPFIDINVEVDESKVRISFADNGSGIKKEYLNNIFKMFYKASERSSGSGLGLYIVNETVKKLGGAIKIDSQYGVGTTFTIEIPNFVNQKNAEEVAVVSQTK